MYLTRQDLKVEVRDLHGQIREGISDFNGAKKNLQEEIEELRDRINNLETIIANLEDFSK